MAWSNWSHSLYALINSLYCEASTQSQLSVGRIVVRRFTFQRDAALAQREVVLVIVRPDVRDVICFIGHRIIESPVGCQAVFRAGQQAVVGVLDFACRLLVALSQCTVPQARFVKITLKALSDGYGGFVCR